MTYTEAIDCGNRIRELRVNRGDTQERMAEKAGLSVDTVKRMENGRLGNLDSLMLLAKACQASLDYIVFGRGKALTEQS